VEGGSGIRKLALAMIERALAASDTAEIEAQHGEIPMSERVVELVDNRVVHGAAELRMGVQDNCNRGGLALGRMVAAFYPAGGAGEDDLGHSHDLNCFKRNAHPGRSRGGGRLTPLAGARNSSETLDFIGPAASRPSAHAGEGAPEGRAGISRIFCPIGG